mmetsp:Transcript_1447/g.1728  ORF Transcript_1447/g.1728 Transcript_1447/m.1728 type:complete len:351 (+) Transcript_1447:286-1338(+)|eukprot:CAMPEP_0184022322 /NCGR_PEP_ID=MMETSP0954-20121128/10532_1 /TAXON_ID=627963 /ORGANISM="Aplanochytrium sp, Strain PBS07" /LENGTH=350 /DNA_ID=CAMNT_0026304665 /DNA_START=240 /DNA_END=1292 /DNA_ORIENTATION=-
MSTVKAALVAVSLYVTAGSLFVQARPSYPNNIPPAEVVIQGTTVAALGHRTLSDNPYSNTAPNAFGSDYLDALGNHGAANLWVNQLCAQDSDGDGLSNGEELCDADCDNVLDTNCTPSHPALAGDSLEFGGNIDLYKLHAALMIIAWVILAPFGILLVIIRKRKPGWFPIHRNVMFGVSFLTVIGFIVILKQLGIDQLGKNNHTKAGLVTTLLALVQPISGILRVHVDGESKSRKRLAWEFQHQWTGRLAMFTGTLAIITGIEIYFGNEDIGYIFAVVFALVTAASFVFVFCVRDKAKYGSMQRPKIGMNMKRSKKKIKSGSYSTTPPPAEAIEVKSAAIKSRTFADFEV